MDSPTSDFASVSDLGPCHLDQDNGCVDFGIEFGIRDVCWLDIGGRLAN